MVSSILTPAKIPGVWSLSESGGLRVGARFRVWFVDQLWRWPLLTWQN